MNDLITIETPKLIMMLTSYLSQKNTHEDIYEYAWELLDCKEEASESCEDFWSVVSMIIHYADEEHWKDGTTQEKLKVSLKKIIELHNRKKTRTQFSC